MQPQAATRFYSTQQRVNRVARLEVRRLWRKMGADFEGGWRRIAPQVLAIITEAQSAMANEASTYVPALLDSTGQPDKPEGTLAPSAFAGTASDGRRLDTLAYQAVVKSGDAYNKGATQTQALSTGGSWLDLMVQKQVADIAASAVGVMLTSRPQLTGYVRYLNPPSCQRCAILAGRWYRWSSGFQRHPHCDCVMLPAKSAGYAETEGLISDPMQAFKNGHIRDLTKAQTKAIEDGADINQVVNARRGMDTVGLFGRQTQITREGVTRRGLYGSRHNDPTRSPMQKEADQARLTPETIYRIAEDRDHAIRLLRKYGYIL